MKTRIAVALFAAFLVVNLVEAGAGAQVRRSFGGQCGTAPCWSTFTVNGGAPPAGVTLTLTQSSGQIQVAVQKSGATDLTGGVSTSDTIHMVLNVGTFDPVVFGTTGVVSSYSETTGGSNTVTIDVKPSASSWKMTGCTVQSCGSDQNPVTASNDFGSMVLGFISDMSTSGASQATINAMRGTWLGTNAQGLALPSFTNGAASFTVAAPHFKTDGVTVNTGFFQFFAPDAFVQLLGVADPTTVTAGSFTVNNSNGGNTTFSVTHQASPAGVLIQAGTNPPTLPTFNYSSPTFTVSKAAAPVTPVPDSTPAPAPATAPDAPTGASAVVGNGQATVSFNTPAANGAAITSYTVTASPGGASASGSGSPITVTGLTNGTQYTFTVTATNSVGTSSPSAASAGATPAGPPGAPTGVTASGGNGSATVSFAGAPANGNPVSAYTVTASPGGASASGSSSPITVSGLANCASYTFTVTATNAVGSGPASAASSVAVPSSGSCAEVSSSSAVASSSTGSMTLPVSGGIPTPSIGWTSGTFPADVAVSAVTEEVTAASTPPALSGFSAGSVALELTFTSGGTSVHSFGDPLDIVFPAASATLAPGYSTDGGTTWTAIPLLAGTTLPAGQPDGYYRDAAGAVHILTRHATYFGLISGLVLKTGNRPTFSVHAPNVYVFLAAERKAAAVVKLETRSGSVLRTLSLTLPAATTRMKIPLPAGLKAGLYLVKVVATSGPATANATLLVHLVGK